MVSESSRNDIDLVKIAHLPRLGRERAYQNASSEISSRSLSQRLNQMRVEDGRRERNKGMPYHKITSLQKFNQATTSTVASASARAGILFENSILSAQQDQVNYREAGLLRSKFAGPAPPISWKPNDKKSKMDQIQDYRFCVATASQKRCTAGLRYFLDGKDGEALLSLSDACLLCIVTHLDKGDALLNKEDLSYLPIHLKERLMGLAGRKQTCQPLNDTALQAILQEQKQDLIDMQKTHQEQDWSAKEEDRDHYENMSSIANLDLSFARIDSKRLKSILTQGSNLLQLRALSLAGYGYDDVSGQKSLVTMTNFMELIGNIPHLELLNLAKTRLYPISKIESLKSKDGRLLDSMTFLKKLSRASLRLKILDLSECDWIIGPDIANIGWYSIDKIVTRSKIIWPRLEHLVLHNCTAFNHPKANSNIIQASNGYVGKWHAAHHGVSTVTNSPYLLDHQPGLGKALLQASDPLAERLEGQSRQRRVASRGRCNDETEIWGPPWQVEDETLLHSSSSSVYPTRCPVSGIHVGSWEWERARVLDAIRGRWGSAINGAKRTAQKEGPYIEVYF